MMSSVPNILGRGVYTFADAARLTGLSRTRVREWFVGSGTDRGRLFSPDYPPEGTAHAISFLDLIDVFVAGQLREHGVSLPTVRKVYAKLGTDLGFTHAFCRKELLTDGKSVFVRGLDKSGEDEIYEALTRQKAFPELILPFLQRIEYERMTAARWRITDGVVLDPAVSFGQPVVAEAVIPTYILAAAYHANGKDAERVADWYNVTTDAVSIAVRFESELAA